MVLPGLEGILKMGRKTQHRFHGSPERFEIVANFIDERFGKLIKYIADVAGGQGILSRLLQKKFNYGCEVIDPRGWVLKGIRNQAIEFEASMAPYYDLIVGLHPDEATHAVAQAALIRPTLIVPCCNFWSEEKLGRDALLEAIEAFYLQNDVTFERITFSFKGPKTLGCCLFHLPRFSSSIH